MDYTSHLAHETGLTMLSTSCMQSPKKLEKALGKMNSQSAREFDEFVLNNTVKTH